MRISKFRYTLVLIVILLIGLLGGGYLGASWEKKQVESKEGMTLSIGDSKGETESKDLDDMRKVAQAKKIIQKHYLQEIDDKKLTEGAIQGMLSTLEDPYSTYMDAEMMKHFDEQIEASFEGIGAEVSMENGKVTIVAPIKGSPAEKVGLRPNDKIIKIDDKSVEGLDLMEAVNKIRGKKGSKVKLEIERSGVKNAFPVEIVRDEIPIETVYAEKDTTNGKTTGIIRLTSFAENTAKDFKTELTNFENEKVDGLIIDVRGNPGGLLEAVEEILGELIPSDMPILQIEDRKGNKEPYYSKLDEKKAYPITVLADEGSASASEILAVALKEAGYDLVGVKTYGKGTVQQAIPLGKDSTIKLTLYKWLSPKGEWIHEKGVKPTVEEKQPAYYYSHPVQVKKPFKFDQTGEEIANLQVMLKGLDFDPGREDGYFDKKTEQAIKDFQKKHQKKETGQVDQDTASMIETEILEKIRSNKDDQQLEKALEVLYK